MLAARGGFEQTEAGVRLRDYDSPEEAGGHKPDDRSDIYSVGAILYEMLTSRRPQHRGASAPSASNVHVPKELDQVVPKAIAPNPESRYQSVPTLAAELRSVAAMLDARGGAGDEEDHPVEPATSVGRVMATALVILAVVAAVVWWVTRS